MLRCCRSIVFFVSATRSSRSQSTGSFTLGRWTAAYRLIAPKESATTVILPDSTKPQHHQVNAFLGDKILGAAAAKVLFCSDLSMALLGDESQDETQEFEKGTATVLFSMALSNKFLRKHAPFIIPDHLDLMYDPSDRAVGSAVEATVGLIHQTSTIPDSNGAIEDLAIYLLNSAKKEMPYFNAKGQLLEMGAEFTTQEIATGKAHKPLFRATILWKSYRVHAEASRKGLAEEMAAQKLMDQLDESIQRLKVRTRLPMDDDDKMSLRSKLQGNKPEWTAFSFNSHDITLKNNESKEDWWRRGADKPGDVFRRVSLTHHIFPSTVQHVRSWSCRWKNQCLVVISLHCDGTVHSFLGSGETRSKARASAAIDAASFVQNLVLNRPNDPTR